MVMKSDIRKNLKKKKTEGPPNEQTKQRQEARRPAGARKPEARRIPSYVLFYFGPT